MDVLKTRAVADRTIPANRVIRTGRLIGRPMSRRVRTIRQDLRLARSVD